MKHVPNALTGLRLVLSLFVFVALVTAGGAAPWPAGDRIGWLERWAFVAFVAAAVTDFFDGWVARRFSAVTVTGRILDPIADKVLVCAAVLGLVALSPSGWTVIPFGLILFREFAVSALREVTAGSGVTLAVTQLAKWKTTLQLVAFGALMLASAWPAFGLGLAPPGWFSLLAVALLWLATAVTLITGWQYGAEAVRALGRTGG